MTPTDQPRHLVTVWNPLYSSEVEQHVAVLLRWAKRYDDGKMKPDDLYVWWGKVKSPNRQQPLLRAPDIRALGSELAKGQRDTEAHLYVTDYRSLFVGDLLAIQEGDLPAGEADHVPPYYAAQKLTCDFWFKLGDMRRLVRDDLPAVAKELAKLKNVYYNDRPVSLYGGMVDIPLVVTRPDDTQFFDPDERDAATDDRLWAEYDAERGEASAQMQRELRDNVLGEDVWSSLALTVQSTIADAERAFRDHRGDPGHDFSSVILGFSKALEIQCNAILRRATQTLPVVTRNVNIDGTSRDMAKHQSLTLGQLSRAIGSEKALADALTRSLSNGGWFTAQLPPILEELRSVRNPGAHAARVGRDEATRWRNRLLGIGSTGILVELARVQPKRR